MSLRVGSAAETIWTHLQTENFEMYTTAGEKRGREAILYFEQVHALFAQMFKSANTRKLPVRIVAFRNEKEFAPFRPGQAAAAFYGSGLERDYIVMQSITPENYPIAVHEYMHRIVNSMGLTYPVWLNEGVAELFATLKPVGNKVQMGMMDINRATVLRTNKMIPLPAFMAVDEKSPIYNERDKAGIFYAQSFALAHMLYFGNEAEFGKLQQAFQKNKDPKEAFLTAYGLTLEAVQRDLEKYMNQNRFFYGVVNVKLEKSEETAEVRPVEDFEVKIMLADLYRINHNWAEAARAYEEAARIANDRPETEEGLAWLALYQQKPAEALPHFVKAIQLGSKRPLVFQHASMLSWGDTAKALEYMKRAVELDPDLTDGNYNLGTLALNAQDPKLALEALGKIKKVTPDRASGLFRTKAHAYLALNNFRRSKEECGLGEAVRQDRCGAEGCGGYRDVYRAA